MQEHQSSVPENLRFRKSQRSNPGNGCVEVADTHEANFVRDSKISDSPILNFPRADWFGFLAQCKAGEYDL